jgi:16S rRNA (cytidine1402-2'-O)-methyltransferase
MAVLYIIGTPIGNLGDMTFRAVETLRSVQLVACEDTRQTLKLLNHFGISGKGQGPRLISVRSQNEASSSEKVITALKEGYDAAYASDAGTPGLSDPGSVLARKVAEAGFDVIPIPGPSAFASIVSVAGAPDKTVVFEGFLSPKPGRRRTRLKELLALGSGFVLYESPFRIGKLLEDLADLDSERYLCVGREMTKIHEEFFRGKAGTVYLTFIGKYANNKIQGEFTVYVSGISA